MQFMQLADCIGNTPLVRLAHMERGNNILLAKLEGNNPAGSVKDRPAFNMIREAERRQDISPGDRLIEATSGNTGIALALAAALKGYPISLIMPENMSMERRASMAAYGAEIVLVDKEGGMEKARDLAAEMAAEGRGRVLNQFANPDNPAAHYHSTGPEIWRDSGGRVSHFVSAMGTTGTIMGVSRYLKEQNAACQIVGVQPQEGASIPGIRRWPEAYLPAFYEPQRIDSLMEVSQQEAEHTMRVLARKEGLFCGVSSGGAVAAARRLCDHCSAAVVVVIICDRGDRYLSTGVWDTR